MTKLKRFFLLLTAVSLILSVCSCKKAMPGDSYLKENAGGTGYGAGIKSTLYIEDFYFVTVGTLRTAVELTLGSPHYTEEGNSFFAVYDLNNGDSIEFSYDEEKNTVSEAEYVYSDGNSENFFDILVEIGILKSSGSESNNPTVVLPNGDNEISGGNDSNSASQSGNSSGQNSSGTASQNVVQGDLFASGMYNYMLIEPVLVLGVPRSAVIASVGKPNYYSSRDFTYDSYIIDCYNLNDGSKLYLDYGYARDNLRCAAIYKNGSYTSLLGASWTAQVKPSGFTRSTISINAIGKLSKNMTPANAYKILGEPAWYEGSQGSYSDVFMLSDGRYAYLNFGSAHNKLTSVSIKEEDGTVTAVTLN